MVHFEIAPFNGETSDFQGKFFMVDNAYWAEVIS